MNGEENYNFLMGGDFNFYIDLELDQQNNMTINDNNPAFRQEINALIKLIESLNVADSLHKQNPTSRRYTWHSRCIKTFTIFHL